MINSRRAFTLIECLAATTLAALLMGALLHVTSSSARAMAVISARQQQAEWDQGILEILCFDLRNAEEVTNQLNAIVIEGHGTLRTTDFIATLCPAQVRYTLREFGGHRWLVREQRETAQPSEVDIQWLCRGVETISLLPQRPRARPAPEREQASSVYRLVVQPTDQSLPRREHSIVLR